MPDKIKVSPAFTPASREQWRKWLESNSSTHNEIWLVYYKKHTGKATITYSESVEEALCFGWIDGIKKRIDDERYCHRFTPRRPDSMWSELNVKRAKDLISKGLMKPSGMIQFEDAISNPKRLIISDRKTPSFDMPGDLAKALRNAGDSYNTFINLPPSYKKMCILWINSAKRPETRTKRIQELTEASALGKKIGMK